MHPSRPENGVGDSARSGAGMADHLLQVPGVPHVSHVERGH